MSFLQPPEPAPAALEAEQAPQDTTTEVTEGSFGTAEKAPTPPVVPENSTADDVKALLGQFIKEQQEWRAQVVKDVRAAQIPPPQPSQGESSEQRTTAKKAAISKHPFYCATCGALHDFLRECVGPAGSNHPPTIVAKTDELLDEPNPLDKEAYATYQAGHTQDLNDPALAA